MGLDLLWIEMEHSPMTWLLTLSWRSVVSYALSFEFRQSALDGQAGPGPATWGQSLPFTYSNWARQAVAAASILPRGFGRCTVTGQPSWPVNEGWTQSSRTGRYGHHHHLVGERPWGLY